MYADRTTGSMKQAIEETDRRRTRQETFNKKYGITPQSITKKIRESHWKKADVDIPDLPQSDIPADERRRIIKELEKKMNLAAQNLEFEKASKMRDAISKLRP
jgi:excinuclease ABC subunit B